MSSVAGPIIPAIIVVKLEILPLHGTLEHILKIGIIGSLLKFQISAIEEEILELVRQRLAQLIDRDRQFLLHYLLVFLFLSIRLQVLPGDRTLHEIQQHVGYALDIVSPSLLNPEVGIQGGKASSSGQIFIILIGNVRAILQFVLLSQPEVDHIDLTGFLPITGHEIIGLNVTVYVLPLMHVFDPLQHLVPDHEGGLQVVLLTAHVEKILQRLPAEIHHHHVVLALRADVVDVGEAGINGGVVLEAAQYLGLVEKLRALGGGLLQFDGVLRVVFDVERHEDLPEGPRAQLLGELVVLRHDAVHKLYQLIVIPPPIGPEQEDRQLSKQCNRLTVSLKLTHK